jgi:heme exporter protein C
VWSFRYLFGGRQPRHDRAAVSAVEVGVVFCVLATVTGAIWAKVMWGAYWNWDPRQVWITVAILFYCAYLALRSAVVDLDARRRLCAAYAVLGLVVAPFLFFILPRMTGFTLHPEPVVNPAGQIEMERRMGQVLLAGSLAFTVLFFWIHDLRCRLEALAEGRKQIARP